MDARAASGVIQACPATSSPSKLTRRPAGSCAAKNRASNRRGRTGGVTQRESGTSRSVRSVRSSSLTIEAKSASPPTSAERAWDDGPAAAPPVGQQDAGLLEDLADRRDLGCDGELRLEVPAEPDRGLLRRHHGPCDEPRVAVGRHPPGRQGRRACPVRRPSMPVGGSGGPRARPGRAGAGRRSRPAGERPRRGSLGRRGTEAVVAGPTAAASSSARSASGSVTGRRQTNPRQTYAVGRPSMRDAVQHQRDRAGRRIRRDRHDLVRAEPVGEPRQQGACRRDPPGRRRSRPRPPARARGPSPTSHWAKPVG